MQNDFCVQAIFTLKLTAKNVKRLYRLCCTLDGLEIVRIKHNSRRPYCFFINHSAKEWWVTPAKFFACISCFLMNACMYEEVVSRSILNPLYTFCLIFRYYSKNVSDIISCLKYWSFKTKYIIVKTNTVLIHISLTSWDMHYRYGRCQKNNPLSYQT